MRRLALLTRAELYALWSCPGVYWTLFVQSARSGRLARVASPQTADEKFTWRRVFDRNPDFSVYCDKLAAKERVRAQGLDIAIPETLWVGEQPEDIPAELLGPGVVLKSNNSWRTNMFFESGMPDMSAVHETVARWLSYDHGGSTFQWGYIPIEPKLFIERLVRPVATPLEDIKVYTFGRRIERVVRLRDIGDGEREGQIWLPDRSGSLVNQERTPAAAQAYLDGPAPPTWDMALSVAREIGADLDHARIDLLSDGAQVWFGEVTIYSSAGTLWWDNLDPNAQITKAWDLRRSGFLRQPPRAGWQARYADELSAILDERAAAEAPLPPA